MRATSLLATAAYTSAWMIFATAAGLTFGPGTAYAQSAPRPPGGHLPTREEINRPSPSAHPRGRARIDSSQALDAVVCAQPPNVHATINTVAFSTPGGTALPAPIQALLAGFKPDVVGDQPVNNACTLRDKASAILRRAGYIAGVQIVPAGDDGILKLQVITARIVDVEIHGDPGPYQKVIKARIAQLQALDPLNEFEAEKILLLADDIPGLDVKLTLRSAGRQPGDVIGDLSVTTRRYNVLANVENYGSRQTGPETAYVRGEIYGLTQNADVTYIGASSTFDGREQRIGQIGHSEALGDRGGRLGVNYVYALSDADFGDFDLRTVSSVGNIEYDRPLARSLSRQVNLQAGLDIIEQKTQIYTAGIWPYNWDKIRVGYARLFAATQKPSDVAGDDGRAFSGGLEIRQGLDILGATKPGYVSASGYSPSRIDGDGRATVVRGQADALVGLGPTFSLAGSFRGQWANKALLSYEEFAVGNLNIGRGYDPGIVSADRAAGLRGEVRAHIPSKSNLKGELFGFYDNVRVWNLYAGATDTDRSLASWGVGSRVYLPGRLVADIMYAKPLNRAYSTDRAPPPGRLLVSLTMQFQPNH